MSLTFLYLGVAVACFMTALLTGEGTVVFNVFGLCFLALALSLGEDDLL